MRALVLEGATDLADLSIQEVASPRLRPGRAIIAVAAAAVNRSDVLNASGMIPVTTHPRVPGRDFAGTVVAGPKDLLGKSFWGTGGNALGFGEDGSHAELISVEVEALVPLPATMTLVEAAAAGLSYFVSSHGLAKAGLGEEPEQTVVVTGAAGGVGAAAASQVVWRGAQLVAAVLDQAERDAVLAAHPGAVVAVAGEDPLEDVVGAATDGGGADIVYDTVGNAVFAGAVESLADGGRMVVITAVPGAEPVPLDLFGFYRRSATLLTANSTFAGPAVAGEALRALLPGFEAGALAPPSIAEEFALEDAAQAYEAVRQGRHGRIVLRPANG